MNKQEIVRKFEQATEGQSFITASQFARLMGCSNVDKCKNKFLSNLERVDKKYYFIPDVAKALMDRVS